MSKPVTLQLRTLNGTRYKFDMYESDTFGQIKENLATTYKNPMFRHSRFVIGGTLVRDNYTYGFMKPSLENVNCIIAHIPTTLPEKMTFRPAPSRPARPSPSPQPPSRSPPEPSAYNIRLLEEMGFSRQDAIQALNATGSIDAATEYLVQKQQNARATNKYGRNQAKYDALPKKHKDAIDRVVSITRADPADALEIFELVNYDENEAIALCT